METSANRCLKRRGLTLKQFFINNEDVKTRISEWGNKENPTIICIHGLGSSSLSFLELGELLKDKYHIFLLIYQAMVKVLHLIKMKTMKFLI